MLCGQPKFLGKPDALQLFRQENYFSRRLEIGKPRGDEVPDLTFGDGSTLVQYDRRRHLLAKLIMAKVTAC